MKKTLLTTVLFAIFLATVANAQQKGWMSRYWDGCKPSCSWSGKQYANNVGRCKECNKQNQLMSTSDQNRSSCDGGNSYTCWDMSPWKVNDNLAYAFAATPSDQCGQCFELEFDGGFQHGNAQATHAAIKGKKLIVMGSNMGGDVGAGQFDLLVPGGGVGQFNSFSDQVGISNSTLGSQYGGILAACSNPGTVSQAQSCIKTGCTAAFGKSGQEWLKAGCDFYADWLMGANNPTMTYKTVTCPQDLVDRYQKAATGSPGSGTTPPQTTNYTLTVSASSGGTVTPSGNQTVASGAATTITASASSNYRFVNWTVVSGPATLTNANTASTTVAITGNATVRANFEQTVTLSVTASTGGTVTPTAQQTVNANSPVSITATANSGYKFVNWTVVSGTATFGNANNASTTVTLSANATVRANFEQTVTLTINRDPTAGGNVTGAGNYSTGVPISISATAASGYVFSGWTVTGSTATIASASSASTTVTLSGNATITANFTQQYTLTVNRSPTAGGTTTPASSQANISAGTAVNISTTVNTGYKFVNWTVVSGTATFGNANSASTTVTLSSNATIRANYVQTFTLTVNSTTGGTATPSTAQTVDAGAATSIAATASSGYRFVNWTVVTGTATIASANSASTTVSLTANATIRANFEEIPAQVVNYTLTINRNPASIGTVTGAGSHPANTAVSISATVPSGYSFTGWTVTTGTASFANATSATTTVTLSSNSTIVANYAQLFTLTVTRNPTAGGTTTPASSQANIAAGTPVSITATAANGYTFTNWTVTSGTATFADANSAATTVTLSANATIRANFTQDAVAPTTYTLTINAGSGGTVNPSGAQTDIAANTPLSITATANNGYTFSNWTVTSGTATFGNANNAATTVTLSANATIRANFTQNAVVDDGSFLEFVVNIMPPGSGRVDIVPNKPLFLQGEVISLTAVANTGYEFDKWEGDDLTGSNSEASTNVWWHRAVFAHFKVLPDIDDNEPPPPPPGDITKRTDTTKIEAEDFDSKVGNFIANASSTDASLVSIGNIQSGHSATYEIEMENAGAYTMQLRVANGMIGTSSRFKVSVNGTNVGTVTVGNTGGWGSAYYDIVTLNGDVQILAGMNTITLNFESAINVDYILLLGEPAAPPIIVPPEEPPITRAVPNLGINTLKIWQTASGMVNLDLGYTPTAPVTLKIYDLKGKLIKSELLSTRFANVHLNVPNGVYLFKLGSKNFLYYSH